MNLSTSHVTESKLILRGIHLSLTEAMRAVLETKAARLLRHEPRILRVRIDVESDVRGRSRVFSAKGRVEIAGPDVTASVTMEDAYAAINLLIAKLERMLRKRSTGRASRRVADDIRRHVPSSVTV